jgi:hypothetical protein
LRYLSGQRARRFLPSASACADVLRCAKLVAVLGFRGAMSNLARPNCFLAPPLAPACEPTGLGLLLLTHRWPPFSGRDAILRALNPLALESEMLGMCLELYRGGRVTYRDDRAADTAQASSITNGGSGLCAAASESGGGIAGCVAPTERAGRRSC